MTERIPEALKAIGLDLEKTDYNAWVAERMKEFIAAGPEEEEGGMEVRLSAVAQLVALAGFYEERGMLDEFKSTFLKASR
ncbi:MAG: hypothetical protein HC767_10310 [Akkermansiaceae bacterium]|nr:hypothetical protein [Akkermansiaceae bacterium]